MIVKEDLQLFSKPSAPPDKPPEPRNTAPPLLLPLPMLDDPDLDPKSFLYLAVIRDHSKNGEAACNLSQKALSDLLEVTLGTARRSIQGLEALGRIQRKGQKINVVPYPGEKVFGLIPRELYERGLVSNKRAKAFRIYAHIARRCNAQYGTSCTGCVQNCETIGKECGISRLQTVKKALQWLRTENLVTRREEWISKHPCRSRYIYHLLPIDRASSISDHEIRGQVEAMLDQWPDIRVTNTRRKRQESFHSIAGACRHAIREFDATIDEIQSGIENFVTGTPLSKTDQFYPYLNQFIRSGRFQEPFPMKPFDMRKLGITESALLSPEEFNVVPFSPCYHGK